MLRQESHMARFATALIRGLGIAEPKRRDPDLEQAVLRVALCVIVLSYVAVLIRIEGHLTYGLQTALIAGSLNTAVGTWMIWQLRRSPERRRESAIHRDLL